MRYWVCINNEIIGPLEPQKLSGVKGFTPLAWACPESEAAAGGARQWKRSISFPELAGCFFPDYPEAARVPPVIAAAPVEQPASPQTEQHSTDGAVIAAINHKLDELLLARSQAGPAAPAGAPAAPDRTVNRKLDAIGSAVVSIKNTVSLQDAHIHAELEPLGRKLDQTEREVEDLRKRVESGGQVSVEPLAKKLDAAETALEQVTKAVHDQEARIHAELEPLGRKLDQTEREVEEIKKSVEAGAGPALDTLARKIEHAELTLEQIREEVRGQDAAMRSGLSPIAERVEQAERAIEEESTLQRSVLGKMAALDLGLAGLRETLEVSSRTARPAPRRAHPYLAALMAAAVFGGLIFGLYRFLGWAMSQGSHQSVVSASWRPPAGRPAAAPSPEAFARGFGAAKPLELAVKEDAAARGAAGGPVWISEAGPDGLPRVVAEFSRPGGRLVYYYYSVDIKAGRLVPLNRGSARALKLAEGR